MPAGPAKRGLGSRVQTGISDATQQVNPYFLGTGWDVVFAPSDLNIFPGMEVEVYHIALDGPVGSAVVVLIDAKQWDYVSQGWANGWDPQQPILLDSGSYLQFCWNVAATNPPYDKSSNVQPTVTVWLRHPVSQVF